MPEPKTGRFGEFGGQYLPESLMPAIAELDVAFRDAWSDPSFEAEYLAILQSYGGRPTPVTICERLSAELGVQISAEARRLGPHRVAQDQQRHRPDSAGQAHGQAACYCRDRRPANMA